MQGELQRDDDGADAPPHIPPGRYRHHKGPLYEVIALARHSETEAWHVVYRALYGDFGLWIRPAAMFLETVQRPDGRTVPRFELVDPA
jgi:hypothetical protein